MSAIKIKISAMHGNDAADILLSAVSALEQCPNLRDDCWSQLHELLDRHEEVAGSIEVEHDEETE